MLIIKQTYKYGEKYEQKQRKIRPVLMGLPIGGSYTFPIIRMKSVMVQASELGAMYGRQYTTTNRDDGTIVVKRLRHDGARERRLQGHCLAQIFLRRTAAAASATRFCRY